MTPVDEGRVRLDARIKTLKLDKKINKFDIGDRVRVQRLKRSDFAKEGKVWSKRLYTVSKDYGKSYNVQYGGVTVKRRYKYYQLLKVNKVESVPKRRKTRQVTRLKREDVERHAQRGRRKKK